MSDHSTGDLMKHAKRKHLNLLKYCQEEYTKLESRSKAAVRTLSCTSVRRTENTAVKKYNDGHPQQRLLENSLLSVVTENMWSFRSINSDSFKEFVALLHPQFTVPSGETLSNKILDREFERIRLTIIDELSQAESLSCSFDGWQTVKGTKVYGVVVHFIRSDATYCTRLLSTMPASSGRQNAAAVKTSILDAFSQFGQGTNVRIFDKVRTCVTDREAKMVSVVRDGLRLEDPFCNVHLLNSMVKSSLKVHNDIHVLIAKIHAVCIAVKADNSLLTRFGLEQKSAGIDKPLMLIPLMEIRFVTAYITVRRFNRLQEPLRALLPSMDPAYSVTDAEWKALAFVESLFAPISDVVAALSSATTATLPCVVPSLIVIANNVSRVRMALIEQEDDDFTCLRQGLLAVCSEVLRFLRDHWDLQSFKPVHNERPEHSIQRISRLLIATSLHPLMKRATSADLQLFEGNNHLVHEAFQSILRVHFSALKKVIQPRPSTVSGKPVDLAAVVKESMWASVISPLQGSPTSADVVTLTQVKSKFETEFQEFQATAFDLPFFIIATDKQHLLPFAVDLQNFWSSQKAKFPLLFKVCKNHYSLSLMIFVWCFKQFSVLSKGVPDRLLCPGFNRPC